MNDFLRFRIHFWLPKFGRFCRMKDFFNTHRRLHSSSCPVSVTCAMAMLRQL